MEEKKRKVFTLYLPEESRSTIKAFAALRNISMNDYILHAIHKQLVEDQSRQ